MKKNYVLLSVFSLILFCFSGLVFSDASYPITNQSYIQMEKTQNLSEGASNLTIAVQATNENVSTKTNSTSINNLAFHSLDAVSETIDVDGSLTAIDTYYGRIDDFKQSNKSDAESLGAIQKNQELAVLNPVKKDT